MFEYFTLPSGLRTVIGSEKKEFAVKAKHAHPGKMSLFMILFGTVWLLFTSIFVVAFLGPLFIGEEVHFESNGVPTVAGPDNLGPIVAPAMIIGFFVLVGVGMLAFGIYSLFKKGGYFIGTPTRLIHYQNGSVRSIDWEQFSGDIEVRGNEQNGNITLQLRTGRMVSSKNSSDRYVPDTVYISGIPGVFEVERICRTRIKENDPTPVSFEDDRDHFRSELPSAQDTVENNPVSLVSENSTDQEISEDYSTRINPEESLTPDEPEDDSLRIF